jgi:hypothetical protein
LHVPQESFGGRGNRHEPVGLGGLRLGDDQGAVDAGKSSPDAHGSSVQVDVISRQAELAADRFATDHGLALELATALRALDDGRTAACGWSWRLLGVPPST